MRRPTVHSFGMHRRAPVLLCDEVIVSLRVLKKVRPNKRPA
jgi:hypothetical protein